MIKQRKTKIKIHAFTDPLLKSAPLKSKILINPDFKEKTKIKNPDCSQPH